MAEALMACAWVRPQVATRYSSTAKIGIGEMREAVAERRRWTEKTEEVAGEDSMRARIELRRRSMAQAQAPAARGNWDGRRRLLVRGLVFSFLFFWAKAYDEDWS